MICDICQAVLTKAVCDSSVSDTGWHPYHQTAHSFKSSVGLGCYTCNAVWSALNPVEQVLVSRAADSRPTPTSNGSGECLDELPEGSVEEFESTSSVNDGSPFGLPGCYLLQLAVHARTVATAGMTGDRFSGNTTFVLQPRNGSELAFRQQGLPQSTNTAESFDLAGKWITSCINGHERCNAGPAKPGWYPTRLLDCGGSEAPEKCRLVETGTTAIDGPYMTLSHCWGLTDCLTLTTENRPQFLDDLPLSLLPKLYQEAFYVTRKLGIRYLWIDSLCIVQRGDQSTDWHHEVTLMDRVYSNSFCNISPTNAPDSHHSMFHARDPNVIYPQTVDIPINGGVASYALLHRDLWENEVARTPLNKRAWVLQERLLSPRVLHFSRNQMFWECRQIQASETYPDGLPAPLLGHYDHLKDLTSSHYTAAGEDGDILASLPWSRIIRAYTACDLTFLKDKLAALSGVAKVMAGIFRDNYVAGMWRRHLERDLLWVVVGKRTDTTQPSIYRAPSWSWAAVDGEVRPGTLTVRASDILIEVLDVDLDYATDDTTSLIKGGWLSLRGVLKRLALHTRYLSPIGGHEDWSVSVNGIQVSSPSGSALGDLQPHVLPDAPTKTFGEQVAAGNLYGMPARVREGDDGSIYFLLLQLENREQGVFRRLGIARGWGKEVKDMILARAAEESEFPCEEYRDGLHTISII